MPFLPPLLFAGCLGALFILYLTRSASIRFYPLFVFSLSFPVGFSICSLLTFFAYLIHSPQGPFLSIAGAMALSSFFLVKLLTAAGAKSDQPTKPLSILTLWSKKSSVNKLVTLIACGMWLLTFVKFWHLFQATAVNNIFGCWDSMFFWNMKASFFFRSPEEWKGMFSPAISWTHQDYPLLLSGSIAWGWNWTGRELQIWPAVVAFTFLFSNALFIAWYLSSAVHPLCGVIASAFFMTLGDFSFWGVNLIADVPISFFFTASGVALHELFRTKKTSLAFIAGWLAGCSTWTKNEGIFFVGWTIIVLALLFIKNKKNSPDWKRSLLYFASGIIIPFLATFILKTFLAPAGDYLGSSRSLSDYIHAIFLDWPKTKIILQAFPVYMFKPSAWNGLWTFFFAAWICLLSLSSIRKTDTWSTGALAVMVLIGYAVVLHISPHPIVWQIQTALSRLIVHAGGLALIFTFEVFGKMLINSDNKGQAA